VSNLAADVRNNFCTILLSSMDDQPIATSAKLFLIAGGPVENTGQAWNTAGTDVTAEGESPTLIEQIKGTITLHRIQGARAVNLQAMDGAGQPTGAPVQATATGDEWTIPVGDTTSTWYQIAIMR
jgi:hypothetical protein